MCKAFIFNAGVIIKKVMMLKKIKIELTAEMFVHLYTFL